VSVTRFTELVRAAPFRNRQDVRNAEDLPSAGQRTAQRRLVIEIALDDVDALARQRRRSLALRLARQAAQAEPCCPAAPAPP
jgi:hypothetical protein